MSVKIGSARIDENGKAHGGAAGDQTGKEVSTQSWYAHTKGWVLLRAKSAEARERIARCMQAACDNGASDIHIEVGNPPLLRVTMGDEN